MKNVLQQYETARQVINDITLMNNRFMNKVLDGDIPSTQRILRVMLKNDKIKVKNVKVQSFLQNLYGHSAQLDILAEDENGRLFNVEVQRSDEGAANKRARFYSSALDMHFLDSGEKYEVLPESYVIFITENDVLQEGRPIYNIERHINESGRIFGDGSHIVYVNASCQDETPLGRLMQDFNCKDPAEMHYKELADRVSYFKSTKEEGNMVDIIEVYAENMAKKAAKAAAAKAQLRTKKETARNLLKSGVAAEVIAEAMKLPLEEVRKLAEKQSA